MNLKVRIDRLEERRTSGLVVLIADRAGKDGALLVDAPIPQARKVVILEPDTLRL